MSALKSGRRKPLLCRLGRHKMYVVTTIGLAGGSAVTKLRCRRCPAQQTERRR